MNSLFVFALHLHAYFFMINGIPPADEKKDYLIRGKVKSYFEYNESPEFTNQTGVRNKDTYEYFGFNLKGLFTERYYVINNQKNSSIVNWYNDKGYRIRRLNYRGDTLLTDSTSFNYDFANGVYTSYQYNIASGTKTKTEYFYNSKKLLIKVQNYNWDEICYLTTEYIYNKQGLVEKEIEYARNKKNEMFLDHYNVFTYDKMGNKVTEQKYNSKDELMRTYKYLYEFDSNKNWVKKLFYIDGALNWITERKIEYY